MPSDRAVKWAKWAPYAVACAAIVIGIAAAVVSANVTHPLVNSTTGNLLSATGMIALSLTMLYAYGFMLLYPDEAVRHEITPPGGEIGTWGNHSAPETASKARKRGAVMIVVLSIALLIGIGWTVELTLRLLS